MVRCLWFLVLLLCMIAVSGLRGCFGFAFRRYCVWVLVCSVVYLLLIYGYGLAECFEFVARTVYYGVSVLVFRFVVVLGPSLRSVCVCWLIVVWLWLGVACWLLVVVGCCLVLAVWVVFIMFWCFGLWVFGFGFCVLGLLVFVGLGLRGDCFGCFS